MLDNEVCGIKSALAGTVPLSKIGGFSSGEKKRNYLLVLV